MEIILIVVVAVLAIFIFWPRKKKPGTPITKSRTAPGMADPETEISEEKKTPESNEIPEKYFTPKGEVTNTSGFFYRKKVCIVGKIDNMRHPDLLNDLWEAGAEIRSSAGDSCDIAICADEAGPMECQKLEEQGITVMDQLEVEKKLRT